MIVVQVEVMTSVEDFKVVLQLKNIGVNLNHSQQETRLIKFKNQTELKAQISGVYVECRRDGGRDKAKVICSFQYFLNFFYSNAGKLPEK